MHIHIYEESKIQTVNTSCSKVEYPDGIALSASMGRDAVIEAASSLLQHSAQNYTLAHNWLVLSVSDAIFSVLEMFLLS